MLYWLSEACYYLQKDFFFAPVVQLALVCFGGVKLLMDLPVPTPPGVWLLSWALLAETDLVRGLCFGFQP